MDPITGIHHPRPFGRLRVVRGTEPTEVMIVEGTRSAQDEVEEFRMTRES
jgi:hypothetical protein